MICFFSLGLSLQHFDLISVASNVYLWLQKKQEKKVSTRCVWCWVIRYSPWPLIRYSSKTFNPPAVFLPGRVDILTPPAITRELQCYYVWRPEKASTYCLLNLLKMFAANTQLDFFGVSVREHDVLYELHLAGYLFFLRKTKSQMQYRWKKNKVNSLSPLLFSLPEQTWFELVFSFLTGFCYCDLE